MAGKPARPSPGAGSELLSADAVTIDFRALYEAEHKRLLAERAARVATDERLAAEQAARVATDERLVAERAARVAAEASDQRSRDREKARSQSGFSDPADGDALALRLSGYFLADPEIQADQVRRAEERVAKAAEDKVAKDRARRLLGQPPVDADALAAEELAAEADESFMTSLHSGDRSEPEGNAFSKFKWSRTDIDKRRILNADWLALLPACGLSEAQLDALVTLLEVYRNALAYLAHDSTIGVGEVHVVQPLVELWIGHLASVLLGTRATTFVDVSDKATFVLPRSGNSVTGSADHVVWASYPDASLIAGLLLEVKRPFDRFEVGGVAQKNQLVIEVACFGPFYKRALFPGLVTDLFRVNVALRVGEPGPDGRWIVYESTRFKDARECTVAALSALAVGFPEWFQVDLTTILTREQSKRAKSKRNKAEVCYAGKDDSADASRSSGSDRDDPRQQGPATAAPGVVAAAAAAPVPVGPSTVPTSSRTAGGGADHCNETDEQQENMGRRSVPGAKFVRVVDTEYRPTLVDVNTGVTYGVVAATAAAMSALPGGGCREASLSFSADDEYSDEYEWE